MHFKIGDKVRFLNEKGEGIISKIINKTTVGVTIEDGFELPFAVSELLTIPKDPTSPSPSKIVEEPVFFNETTSKSIITKEEQEGIYMAFSPEKMNDIAHSDFNVWLINYTGYQILFSYSIVSAKGFKTVETGTIQAFENLLVETIDRKLLTESSNFKVDILFFNEQEHVYQAPISEIVKLKPIKLYKENAFADNNFISEKALIINITKINTLEEQIETPKIDLSKILLQKRSHFEPHKKSKPHISNNPAYELEIDLHIEELVDTHAGMSNAEIIQIQLKHLQRAIDKAIAEHCRKLVVIHGVGNGRLKSEVHAILDSLKLRYHDGSYAKYGFGATEIVIA